MYIHGRDLEMESEIMLKILKSVNDIELFSLLDSCHNAISKLLEVAFPIILK